MRIAVYHNLPSGGAKRTLNEVTRRLARTHHLDVYTLSTADHDFCDLRPYCAQHVVFPFRPMPLARRPFGRLNQGIRALDLFRLQALQRKVAARIDTSGYDVVFVDHCQYSQSPALLRFLATPSVYYLQEAPRFLYEPRVPRPYIQLSAVQRLGNLFDPLPPLYRRILARLDRAAALAASLVVTNSAFSYENLYRTYGLFARVWDPGVDTERFRPLSVPKGEFVLSVGVVSPLKGFDFLLRSLALLDISDRPPLRIVSNFVSPPERSYLEELGGRLGVLLDIHERISDDELVQVYNHALLTLYAPIMEPFGLAPLESMACATPVVGVREGGVRESIVDGVTGLLVDRDPGQFAEAVRGLLANEEQRTRYGRQAREHVLENWTCEASAVQLERHLADAASAPRKI